MKPSATVQNLWRSFSYIGLAVGTLLFATSLSPSLLPRHYAVQGVLSGVAFSVGYCIGILCIIFWQYLQLPQPTPRTERISKFVTTVIVSALAVGFLWRTTIWQNSIRQLMAMEPLETAYPLRVALIAMLTGIALLLSARMLRGCWRFVDRQAKRILPPRISFALSTMFVGLVLFLLVNDVVARFALHVADSVFANMEEIVPDGVEQPQSSLASGSPDSLIPWETIGRQGKSFVTMGPTQASIASVLGRESLQPLRVYVGLASQDTMEERAQLALDELIRIGGFERSTLIVATPTGTGWLDPGAVDTVEYLHAGDTAIVSMQYSYLPSWITIAVDPNRSKTAAKILFDHIYNYWKKLEESNRPKLYVHGLSLGSLGAESCADLFTVFDDPIQGGVYSGPPFPSTVWSNLVAHRNPESLQWLPTYRDGSMIRFTSQRNALENARAPWGKMRFVYIQHASDPMVFFSPDLLFKKPQWLIGERGPDVSPYFQWYPLVTFLQVGFDIPMATSVPIGYGHNYAPENYLDAWLAVTQPDGWNDESVGSLKAALK